MDFTNLSELSVLADCIPQPRPIALAFFSTEALRTFLRSAPVELEEHHEEEVPAAPPKKGAPK
jgi:hypothetical protein